jgi:type II secretory ATPase GspE/PulE/Tfp pilus assembly ATPase PilB-like protein
MGIEPYQVTSSISAVVNQRLVRRLCQKCRKQTDDGFAAVGCSECFETGFKGKALMAEMVQLDSRLRRAILAKADLEELENLLKDSGHAGMFDDARRLVAEGVTTMDEFNKVCGTTVERF